MCRKNKSTKVHKPQCTMRISLSAQCACRHADLLEVGGRGLKSGAACTENEVGSAIPKK